MILPGISGAFILLILGKYEFVTAALKNPFLPENLVIILVFCCGCTIGLLGFSRLLNYLLQRYANGTLAFLTGLMAGSVQKIWPWKEFVEHTVVLGKVHVLQDRNVLTDTFDVDVGFALLLAGIGFAGVILLEHLSHRRHTPAKDPSAAL